MSALSSTTAIAVSSTSAASAATATAANPNLTHNQTIVAKIRIVYRLKVHPPNPCFTKEIDLTFKPTEKELPSLVDSLVRMLGKQVLCQIHLGHEHEWSAFLLPYETAITSPPTVTFPNREIFTKIFQLFDPKFSEELFKHYDANTLVTLATTIFMVFPLKLCPDKIENLFLMLTDGDYVSKEFQIFSSSHDNYWSSCGIIETEELVKLLQHVWNVDRTVKRTANDTAMTASQQPSTPPALFLESLQKDLFFFFQFCWNMIMKEIQKLNRQIEAKRRELTFPQPTHVKIKQTNQFADTELANYNLILPLIQNILRLESDLIKGIPSSKLITVLDTITTDSHEIIEHLAFYEAMLVQNRIPQIATIQGTEKMRFTFFSLLKSMRTLYSEIDRTVQQFVKDHDKEIVSENFTHIDVLEALKLLQNYDSEKDEKEKNVAISNYPLVAKLVETLKVPFKAYRNGVATIFSKLYCVKATADTVMKGYQISQVTTFIKWIEERAERLDHLSAVINNFLNNIPESESSYQAWFAHFKQGSDDKSPIFCCMRNFQGLNISVRLAKDFLIAAGIKKADAPQTAAAAASAATSSHDKKDLKK